MNNILIERYKDMIIKSDFEQDYWSRTEMGIHKIGRDCISLMKGLICYDRYITII